MLIEFFVMLLGGAVAALIVGLKMKKWLLTFFSMIAFFIIAIQPSIEIASGKIILVFQERLINLIGWAGTFMSLFFTGIGFISYAKERKHT